MHPVDPKEGGCEWLCVSWAMAACAGWSTRSAFTASFMQWRVVTQPGREEHRAWAESKKQTFLELEWKSQHYLAATSLFQTVVQEEPSRIWENHEWLFSPGFILPTSARWYSQANHLPSSPSTGPDPPRGSATTTWEFMSKAAAQEEQGVFCCCTSEPWWPLEWVIALSIICIILSGLGPRLKNEFSPRTSCWN